MKYLLFFVVVILIGCENGQNVYESEDAISFRTDKEIYSRKDSIRLTLENNSGYDLSIGYRCSEKNLEMSYQKKENDKWSENRWFTYMYLKCMTIPSKVEDNTVLRHAFSAVEFGDTGTFRLQISCYLEEKDTTLTVLSNSFKVEK